MLETLLISIAGFGAYNCTPVQQPVKEQTVEVRPVTEMKRNVVQTIKAPEQPKVEVPKSMHQRSSSTFRVLLPY